jgi:hypothetical protein
MFSLCNSVFSVSALKKIADRGDTINVLPRGRG